MCDHIGDEQSAPRLGCGAAIIDKSRILLVKRKRNPEADHWGLPGGKIEPGEGVEDAIVREISEELGITVQLRRWLCTVDHRDDCSGQWWVAQVYSASIISGAPRICEPHALAAVEWFALDRLPAPLTAATVRPSVFWEVGYVPLRSNGTDRMGCAHPPALTRAPIDDWISLAIL